jgi:hypothetical protein
MANPTCNSCHFWELDVDQYERIRVDYPAHPPDGNCFRFPPINERLTRTNAYYWCGEYKVREEDHDED